MKEINHDNSVNNNTIDRASNTSSSSEAQKDIKRNSRVLEEALLCRETKKE